MNEKNIREDRELYAYYVQRNETLVEDNYTYLTRKPEIKQLLNDYMANLLLHKPDDVFKFTKDYYSILADVPNIAKLLILVGPSGVGKGELSKRLMQEFPHFTKAISFTSRNKRSNEVDGKDYYFISKEKFMELILKKELIEHNMYMDNYYGTSKQELKRVTNYDKIILIELDVNGANKIYNQELDANYIALLPTDTDTLRVRMQKRNGDSEEEINKKLDIGLEEVKQIENSVFYNYKIYNDVLEDSYRNLRNAVISIYPWLLKK